MHFVLNQGKGRLEDSDIKHIPYLVELASKHELKKLANLAQLAIALLVI